MAFSFSFTSAGAVLFLFRKEMTLLWY